MSGTVLRVQIYIHEEITIIISIIIIYNICYIIRDKKTEEAQQE